MPDFGDEYVIRIDEDPALAAIRRVGDAVKALINPFNQTGGLASQKMQALADQTDAWADALNRGAQAAKGLRSAQAIGSRVQQQVGAGTVASGLGGGVIEQEIKRAAVAADELAAGMARAGKAASASTKIIRGMGQQSRRAAQSLGRFFDIIGSESTSTAAALQLPVNSMEAWIDAARRGERQIFRTGNAADFFGDRAKRAAQQSTNGLNLLNSKVFQGAQAIEDFSVGFQLNGIQGGLRGAANNIGFMVSQTNAWAGAAVTVGLALGGSILPHLIESADFTARINQLQEEQNRLFEERKRAGDAILSADQERLKLGRNLDDATDRKTAAEIAQRELDIVEERSRALQIIQQQQKDELATARQVLALQKKRLVDRGISRPSDFELAGGVDSRLFTFRGIEEAGPEMRAAIDNAISGADPELLKTAFAEALDVSVDGIGKALLKGFGREAAEEFETIVNALTRIQELEDKASESGRQLAEARGRAAIAAKRAEELPIKENKAAKERLDTIRLTETAFDRFAKRRRDINASNLDAARKEFELAVARAGLEDAINPRKPAAPQTPFQSQRLGFDALAGAIQDAAFRNDVLREEKRQTRVQELIEKRIQQQTEQEKDNAKTIANAFTSAVIVGVAG